MEKKTTTNKEVMNESEDTIDISLLCEDLKGIGEDMFFSDKAKELNDLVTMAYILGSSTPQGIDKESLLKSLQSVSKLLTYIQTNGSWAWDRITEATNLIGAKSSI